MKMMILKILIALGCIFMSRAREIRLAEESVDGVKTQSEVEKAEFEATVIENNNTGGDREQAKDVPANEIFEPVKVTEKDAPASENTAKSENTTEKKSKLISGRSARFTEITSSQVINLIFGHLIGAIEDTINAYVDLLPLLAGCAGGAVGCHVCVAMVSLDAGPKLIINKCLEKCTPGLFGACIGMLTSSVRILLTTFLSNL